MAEPNYEFNLDIKRKREFTLKELSQIFGYSTGGLWLALDRLGIKGVTRCCGSRSQNFYTYDEYLQAKASLKKEKLPKLETDSIAEEHPLVTDKRCLCFSWWPDTTIDYGNENENEIM